MEFIINKLAEELKIRKSQVEKTIELLDEGNTVPFISRYRKEVTGGLTDEQIRNLSERLSYLRNLEQRKLEVVRIIDEQGKLTDELRIEIEKAEQLQRVEDLYMPYKQKKSTRGSKARDKGLLPLMEFMLSCTDEKVLLDEAAIYVDNEKEVVSPEDAIAGAKDIYAEVISDDAAYRNIIRTFFVREGVIESKGDEGGNFDSYADYSEPVMRIPNHRILAINRGEHEKLLKIKLVTPDDKIVEKLLSEEKKKHEMLETIQFEVAADAYKRLIRPSVERELRNVLTERAEEDAIDVFGKNTRNLLLSPPVKGLRVLGIDPSFRTGCKLAAVDDTGKFLEYKTIYPNEPKNDYAGSKRELARLIDKYDIQLITIGNGTASRETESFVARVLKEESKGIPYTIVSEAGASVYSASKLAMEEFPDLDVSIRGAISIARRIQDPLAELVKIDPKSIGVGQYQHDVNQKRLSEKLGNVVEDAVNSVGVDVNTASYALLSYVSGISSSIAKNIVAYRDDNGKFGSRKELLKVKRLGDKVFEQAAGFIRIPAAANPLDNTSVHPESYDKALLLIDRLGYLKEDVRNGIRDIGKRVGNNLPALARELGIGEPTLRDIVEELRKPGRDPRDEMPGIVFRNDVLSIDDLSEGMVVSGTVRNVVNFGAFIDIGVKNDGLCHISELSDGYVKNPMDVVAVGDVVTARIIGIDRNRNKISLSMKGVKK